MAITEKFSKKRGRPKVASEIEQMVVAVHGPHPGKSSRTKTNFLYQTRAMKVIMDDDRYEWLSAKQTILYELGRIQDEDERKEVALELCQKQPKTKDAVAMLRRYRLGREVESDEKKLLNHFLKAIDDYKAVHPSVSFSDIAEALRQAAGYVSETDG